MSEDCLYVIMHVGETGYTRGLYYPSRNESDDPGFKAASLRDEAASVQTKRELWEVQPTEIFLLILHKGT